MTDATLIESVAAIMRETALAKIMPYFGFGKLKAGDIKKKAQGELVTIADLGAERFISRRLSDLLPGALVIGEEAHAKDPSVIINLTSALQFGLSTLLMVHPRLPKANRDLV